MFSALQPFKDVRKNHFIDIGLLGQTNQKLLDKMWKLRVQ